MMEYMSAGSCYEIIRFQFRNGFSHEPYIATILYEITKSLAYLHDNRQMHRDVKAGNILINELGHVKIGDFGIAANLLESGHRKRARYTVIGTPCYMAPEVLKPGTGYTERADIWSLGITAIELATGNTPYSHLHPLEVVVRISNSPAPTLPDNRGFSSAFHDWVRACLHVTPSKRSRASDLLEMKFLKQRVPPAELARGLLNKLPRLHERFDAINAAASEEFLMIEKKSSTEWDFGNFVPVEPGAELVRAVQVDRPVPSEEPPEIKRVGRFTLTTERRQTRPSEEGPN
jgi:serine/threonine-protein kinase OSR1/STK39